MDADQSNLQIEDYTALKKTLTQREEDCETYRNRISELEILLQKANKDPNCFQEIQVATVQVLQDTLSMIYGQHKQLQEKFFKLMDKKNEYKKLYKSLQETQKDIPQRTNTETESLNEQLRKEKAELENNIESWKEKYNAQNKLANDFQNQYEEGLEKLNNYIKAAEKNYESMKIKYYEAKEGKPDLEGISEKENEINELKNENQALQASYDELNDSAQKMASKLTDFMNNLGETLGCQAEPQDIADSVKALSQAKNENRKLRNEIESLKILGTVDQNEAYSHIIDSLKEMQSKISPDELKLDTNSPIRQLFAALSNMINAAISPGASRATLQSHVKAVYYQARAFTKEDLEKSNYDTAFDDNNNKQNSNINNNSNVDFEIGNTFSSIPANSKLYPSQFEFPSAKSPK